MSAPYIIEVLAESGISREDAAVNAVDKPFESLHNISSIYIHVFEAKVVDNNSVNIELMQ
ncbi:dodecin domain-containing protein [Thiohalophilus sp.]|uniref:dodecin domain-containing protein n=1 Tax=Thiohalophilus sp. TaxID=3028392 RepID=UPI0039764911